MPTYAQLQSEVWWQLEYQPPTLAALCERLRDHFGVSAAALGSKGDNNHLYGYHRSRAWILNSAWSAYGDGDYSVQATLDLQGEADWLCAVDFTPGDAATMITVCQRLDAAVHAGLCPQLREWYGNVDGDQYVDGWDLLADRAASSDSSHLWHLHMSFLRSRAGDDHSNLLAILTGEDDMTPEEHNNLVATDNRVRAALLDGQEVVDDTPGYGPGKPVWIVQAVKDIQAKLASPVPVVVDAAAVAAALAADPVFLAAVKQAGFEGAQRAERE